LEFCFGRGGEVCAVPEEGFGVGGGEAVYVGEEGCVIEEGVVF
jgi:hypothetical protein